MYSLRNIARVVLPIFVASTALSGCETVNNAVKTSGDFIKEHIPEVAGFGLGAWACSKLYKGENKAMVTALCAAGGAWIGSKLKEYLKKPEDQAKVAKATYSTLDTGKAQTVTASDGTTVTTQLVQPAPTTPTTTSNNKSAQTTKTSAAQPVGTCGTVKQTIVTNNKQKFEETVTACKGEDGAWVV